MKEYDGNQARHPRHELSSEEMLQLLRAGIVAIRNLALTEWRKKPRDDFAGNPDAWGEEERFAMKVLAISDTIHNLPDFVRETERFDFNYFAKTFYGSYRKVLAYDPQFMRALITTCGHANLEEVLQDPPEKNGGKT